MFTPHCVRSYRREIGNECNPVSTPPAACLNLYHAELLDVHLASACTSGRQERTYGAMGASWHELLREQSRIPWHLFPLEPAPLRMHILSAAASPQFYDGYLWPFHNLPHCQIAVPPLPYSGTPLQYRDASLQYSGTPIPQSPEGDGANAPSSSMHWHGHVCQKCCCSNPMIPIGRC